MNTSKSTNHNEHGEFYQGDIWLEQLCFNFPFRKYQKQIIELCKTKLDAGEKELHIVAPPGAGKTIIGLEIIAQFKCPSLVLCPTTTIQAQWKDKLDHFINPTDLEFARQELLGSSKDRPLKPITVMTYQALSLPGKEKEYIDRLAREQWTKELTRNISSSRGEAEVRILDLEKNNSKSYRKEIARHASRIRRNLVDVLNLDEVLHEHALDLLSALKRRGVGLVLFDECHHLTDYWAAVMIHLVRKLEGVTVVGLTGTPPTDRSNKQRNRYLSLVGEIDYQVPTPALVKEGGLAPFQDLVFFTEPMEKELEFLANSHADLHELLQELSMAKRTLETTADSDKSHHRITNRQGSTFFLDYIEDRTSQESEKTPAQFFEKKPELVIALTRFLWSKNQVIGRHLPYSDATKQTPVLNDWINLLEDYALNYLKTSNSPEDKLLFERIARTIKKVGYSLSERGIRKVASPVDRVLAYSKSKAVAIAQILLGEYSYMQDKLRAVVITDFMLMSATSTKPLKGIMDADAGGSIGVLKALLKEEISNYLNPCMVTGTCVAVDNRIVETFLVAANQYLIANSFDIKIETENKGSFTEITASSAKWNTRLYVGMITNIFERGITKCLIGTKGILSEGWDCQELNTIIDLTTSTSTVSVNQLRGRGIRLNTKDFLEEKKVANNWDVVCIAPSLEKGLNDYYRFVKKHKEYFGIADDGQIECGVGHVHPQFSELTPIEVFGNFQEFNYEMLERAVKREEAYKLWQVGEPYKNDLLTCIEVSKTEQKVVRPLYLKNNLSYANHALEQRKSLNIAVRNCYGGYLAMALPLSFLSLIWSFPMFCIFLPVMVATYLANKEITKQKTSLAHSLNQHGSMETDLRAMAEALLYALQERKFLQKDIKSESININRRLDGSYRIFLDQTQVEHADMYVSSLEELLAPVTNQPWVIPKYELVVPEAVDHGDQKFLDLYLSGKLQSRIVSYHSIPRVLARSEAGRDAFEFAWNNHVSPGFVISTDQKPEILENHFGIGPCLSQKLLWD